MFMWLYHNLIIHVSEVERASDILVSLLLFFKVLLEFIDTPLQVAVYLDISGYDSFHPTDVLIDVVFNLAYTLHIGDKFSLFGQKLSCFFQVLKVTVEKFLFLFHDTVYLFVESKELLRINHVFSSTTAAALAKASHSLAFISTGPQSVFEVVPILLLLLLKFLLIAQYRILLLSLSLSLGRLLLRRLLLCRDDILPLRALFLFRFGSV